MVAMRGPSLFWLLAFNFALLGRVQSLYFYFEAGTSKCFYEQLPVDTIAVGHYYIEEWNDALEQFDIPKDLGLGISVTHTDTQHALVSSRGQPDGRFAFSSHEPGMHEICFRTEYHADRVVNNHLPELRMHLDLVIGDSHRPNTEEDRLHTSDLVARARALNAKMHDLRKEQQFQREREMEFRDMSEAVNSRVFWCIFFQIVVLIGACAWQMMNLRVRISSNWYLTTDFLCRQEVPLMYIGGCAAYGFILKQFLYSTNAQG